MAKCPNCHSHLSIKQVLTGPLRCQECGKLLKFPRHEYRNVTRPGFYIAVFILANSVTVADARMRFAINGVLLVLWFIFFKRFIRYIHETMLELSEDQ
ncbi:MAG: hypothetical protein KC900_14830 [Candidatus Omnitrophica bacterium]|nr:hypothetical protein [Candidatus Omnitrophota bacterium]